MVVQARNMATFKPVNPHLRKKSPSPVLAEEEPTVVDLAPKKLQGGLQSAAQLAEETASRAKQEAKLRKKALKEAQAMGEGETVYRDATGKARDTKKEKAEARKKERDKLEKEMQRMEWGKGLVQREDKERRKREEEEIAARPVAR